MKLVCIEGSNSSTKVISLNDLKDQDGNDIEIPPDPENNLVFDPRPIRSYYFYHGASTYHFEIQDSARLVIALANDDGCWADLYFRVYDRTKEDIPPAFDSSVPYDYWGLNQECIPHGTVTVKVHHTVTTINEETFYSFGKLTTCDMSNAPVEEIRSDAFASCTSVRSVLFSQGLRKIGCGAFYACKAIDVLVIPSTVTNIEDGAFACSTNMRILKLPDAIDLDDVGDDIIEECDILLDKVPPNQTPKQWLKHRYDPYPLHKVCYNAHVTIEQIQQCILAHSHAAYLSDEFDMTALHMITIMACTSNLHLQTQSHNQDQYQEQGGTCLLGGAGHITACFDANMSAAFAPDDRDKTPLDYLLESCDGLDVHTALVTSLCLHRCASSSVESHGASAFRQQHSFKRRRYH